MSDSTNRSELFTAIVEGDFDVAEEATQNALDAGATAQEVLEKHIVPAMGEVGELFDEGEYFVPELIMASRAVQEAMKVLEPLLRQAGVERLGCVVIGAVQGDMHDIGKNLVAAMLDGGGFETIDLGVNVAPEKFVEAVKSRGDAKTFVAMSALLTTTIPQMQRTIELFKAEGLRDSVKFLVGGAPVTREFAESIGADGYSQSANECVAVARELAKSWS